MADNGAIVISWGNGRAGIPLTTGMGVLAKSLAFYDEAQKAGRITGYRVYASTARSAGMLVIEGPLAELAKLQVETESLQLLAVASAVVDDINVELHAGGSPDDATSYYLTGLQAIQEAGVAT